MTAPWLLPEGIDEVLPGDAWRLELLRRRLLDLYRCWGYQLVLPPLVEFLDALLTGSGTDLDLQTFKFTDQPSGRMLGLRADMTPQVARIDAHRLNRDGPTRLCYMGTVLHTRSDGFGSSRSPLQFGAELYGHRGAESDLEILALLLASLNTAGVGALAHLDLGHVAIFRGLVRQAGLNAEDETELFRLLQAKALPELRDWLTARSLAEKHAAMLQALADLNGADDTLDLARRRLADADAEVHLALDELALLAGELHRRHPGLALHFDLAELRGYHYHTGVVFAAYVPGRGQEIARGGRYDGIGERFGRARPATGFSADLKTLLALAGSEDDLDQVVYAPLSDDPRLEQTVRELRAAGRQVIQALPTKPGVEPDDPRRLGCDHALTLNDDRWVVTVI